MTDWIYPTAFDTFGDEEREAAQRVLDTGRLTYGAEVKAFEREFAEFHDKKHAIMCNSGSSANLLMVAALFNKRVNPLRPGDQVIVPALAWSTTYAPLVQHGLDVVLHDVEASWNASPLHPPVWRMQTEQFERVRLIVGVSILGIPSSLMSWKSLARVIEAYFIEDNCESLGARDKHDRRTGTYGLMSSSSFFFSHQLNGIEGGMVLTDDDELAELCRMLRSHGWTRDVRPPKDFEGEYDFQLMGYNLRPLEINAAVARVQLRKLPEAISWRHTNAMHFHDRLGGNRERYKNQQQPMGTIADVRSTSFFGIHFLVPEGTRQRVVEALRSRGVDCRLPCGGSVAKHAYGRRWANQATPNADRVHECGLFIGNAPWDIRDKVDMAVDIINGVIS